MIGRSTAAYAPGMPRAARVPTTRNKRFWLAYAILSALLAVIWIVAGSIGKPDWFAIVIGTLLALGAVAAAGRARGHTYFGR